MYYESPLLFSITSNLDCKSSSLCLSDFIRRSTFIRSLKRIYELLYVESTTCFVCFRFFSISSL